MIRDQMHLGVDFIQIREKDLTAREVFEFTLAVLEIRDTELPKHLRSRILINSRADIAVATGADGVHLPSDAPAQTLPRLLVFRSCHTLAEVEPVYETLPGWQLKPDDSGVNSSTQASVVITKSPGYASVVINSGPGGSGSHFQIFAYPNGNQ